MVAIALPLVPVLAPNVAAGAAFVAAGSAAYLAQGAYQFRRGPAPLPPLTGLEGVPSLAEMIADFAAGARVPVGFPLPPPLPPGMSALLTLGAAGIAAAWGSGRELSAGLIRFIGRRLLLLSIPQPPDVVPTNDRIELISEGFSFQSQNYDELFSLNVYPGGADKRPFPLKPPGYSDEQWPKGEYSPTVGNFWQVGGTWYRLGLFGEGYCQVGETRSDHEQRELLGTWILEKTEAANPSLCNAISPEKRLFRHLNMLRILLEEKPPIVVPTVVPVFRPLIKPIADPVAVPAAPVPQLLPAPFGLPGSPMEVLTGTPVRPPRPINRAGWTGSPLVRDRRLPTFPGPQPFAPETPDGPGLTPNEIGTGVEVPSPSFPQLPPLIQPLPKTPQKTGTDGRPIPQAQARPKPTKTTSHIVGTQVVPAKAPRPDLVAIAAEVGRIEQKAARIMREGPQNPGPGLGDLAGLVQQVIQALAGLNDQGSYSLGGPCERDEQGNAIPFAETVETWEWGGSPFVLQNIAQRVDVLAEMMQKAQLLRQPTCKNPPPVGELVSVQFREVDQ